MIFITGAANVGKTSLIKQLREDLPSSEFDVHDIDETGRWTGDYVVWRNEKIEQWLQQSVSNKERGIETILSGIIFPADVVKSPSFGKAGDVTYILLDASSDDIEKRFGQKRMVTGHESFQSNTALHLAAQTEIANRLKKNVQDVHGYIIDTRMKTKEQVAEQAREYIGR